MDRIFLQELMNKREDVRITYKREKDETIKSYHLKPIEIKFEILKDGTREL
ncbi:MAG: hypothetical protein HYY43_06535 [Deltaproteobacteria bacterium]|nr:hypothetical protein [Deltaproteobacteria bacterium]MBI2975226.1 hypothetical protein [Deltaproteobacteria bacterium]